MEKNLQSLLGAFMLLSTSATVFAQETQVKFFGQPEFQSQTITEQGAYYKNPAFPLSAYGVNTAWKDSTYLDSTKSAFAPGKYVLFVTSQLTDKISILSENTAGIINGAATFEVQRLFLKYTFKNYLSFRVGKMFNPIGIWNNKYNLGLVLQPTIQRPSIIRAGTDGGVLQIKNTGVQIEGDNITKLNLFYRLFVCNGAGSTELNGNTKNQYAVTAALGFEPIDGLKVLVSGHYDVFNKNKPNLSGYVSQQAGKSLLSNVSLAYMNPEKKIEFMAEYYYQSSMFDSLGEKNSQGLLAYLGYKITNKFIPYLQLSHLVSGTPNNTDFYYLPLTYQIEGINGTRDEISLGARYKFNANFVVKFEYTYTYQQLIYRDKVFPFQQTSYASPFGVLTNPDYVAGDKINKKITHGPRIQFAFAF